MWKIVLWTIGLKRRVADEDNIIFTVPTRTMLGK